MESLPPHSIRLCESPQQEVWRLLELMAAPSQAEELLMQRHPARLRGTLLADKKADFARCVQQAKEYFTASERAGTAIAPVLLYYGMTSLAVGLALVLHRDLALRSVPRQHGLDAGDLSLCRDVLDAECTPTERGVFPLLRSAQPPDWHSVFFSYQAATVGNMEPRNRRSMPSQYHSLRPGWTTSGRFRLSDLLARLPDLNAETGAHPRIAVAALECSLSLAQVRGAGYFAGRLDVRVPDGPTGRALDDYMALHFANWPLVSAPPDARSYRVDHIYDLGNPNPPLRDATSGLTFLILSRPVTMEVLPEMCELLIAGYLLSALARYYPQVWMGRPRSVPETVLITDRFVRVAQRRFPNLVLNALLGCSCRFTY